LASGAGADRLSTGMAHSFGKPIGIAAQVSKGQAVFSINTTKANTNLARAALKSASYKLPCGFSVVVREKKK
jgi:large subunit ribosomal protein L10e